jgi:hypothetical protein
METFLALTADDTKTMARNAVKRRAGNAYPSCPERCSEVTMEPPRKKK